MIDLKKVIAETHTKEDELMRQNGQLDKKIKECIHEKKKIAIKCSKLVLYRNRMVNLLKDDKAINKA